MKFKFKVQPYQTNAVDAVLGCFEGQPKQDFLSYRIDPGKCADKTFKDEDGFKNGDLRLNQNQILENMRAVQLSQNLHRSDSLIEFTTLNDQGKMVAVKPAYRKEALNASPLHLDVEMETGTGKTYVYIKTMFEMHKRYGWSKFIIMVPSVAIREGVAKSFEMTAEHFAEAYGKKARWFIYNSKRLHELENFSSDAGINVMIINVQAFNARGADNRRIYDELDDFQSRRPIDVIAANRPILILDEPQKMEGPATMEALPKFKPLMVLRYSATHRTRHNLVHRLDALDAYNHKLVKKIAVKGIRTAGLTGTNAYLYLESIEISKAAPVARIEMEVKLASGKIKRQLKRLKYQDNLFALSGELDQYRDRFVISQIDYNTDTVEFTNGIVLKAGEARGDVTERDKRRIQIRETIKSHFEKERQLFSQGIKVLSLFFIDEVAKYRDYSRDDEKGEYARIFEDEYEQLRDEYLSELPLDNKEYRAYLEKWGAAKTHKGYFSIDKKTKRLTDPNVSAKKTESDDSDAYDLILRDKERLLSFEEPTRFIFSHSALREGWDNPNVFVMCMLKHSDNTISRRQEVGRGLRISVDKYGNRMDDPTTVHNVNVLTVVTGESYTEFVSGLQSEMVESLSTRPRKATEAYFINKIIPLADGTKASVNGKMAKQIHRYLVVNRYIDFDDHITQEYHDAKKAGERAALPADLVKYAEGVYELIDSVFDPNSGIEVSDARSQKTNPRNDNFYKKEFQELWSRINRKAVYRVEFDSSELERNCIDKLNKELKITPLSYTVEMGEQGDLLEYEDLENDEAFGVKENRTEYSKTAHSAVKYDLLGNLAESTQLTRKSIAHILTGVNPGIFDAFKQNPESFLTETSRIINEQKAAKVIERLTYNPLDVGFETSVIFTDNQTGQDFSRATEKLKNHVYDYVITDSNTERKFAKNLDTSAEVVVYAKLPKGFFIPTPVGDYNPDWAISFKDGVVKHVYFVAETKGSMSSLQLRAIEEHKVSCARKYFEKLSKVDNLSGVKFDVVSNYEQLLGMVR